MTTLRQFADKMRKLDRELPQQVNSIVVRAAWAVFVDLVMVTPVDTSKALSNWQPSLSSPVGTELPAYVVGQRGSTAGESVQATLDVGAPIIQSKQPGQVLYISNLVDYIEDLNNGSSRQAPANFVERSILIGNHIIQESQINVY
jgi:hypothetical protein